MLIEWYLAERTSRMLCEAETTFSRFCDWIGMKLTTSRWGAFFDCEIVELSERVIRDDYTRPVGFLKKPILAGFDDLIVDYLARNSCEFYGIVGDLVYAKKSFYLLYKICVILAANI